jgi:hypothetical protein
MDGPAVDPLVEILSASEAGVNDEGELDFVVAVLIARTPRPAESLLGLLAPQNVIRSYDHLQSSSGSGDDHKRISHRCKQEKC